MIFDRLSNSTLKLRRALGIQTLHGAKPDVPPPPLPDHIRNARPRRQHRTEYQTAEGAALSLPSEGEAENNILTGKERNYSASYRRNRGKHSRSGGFELRSARRSRGEGGDAHLWGRGMTTPNSAHSRRSLSPPKLLQRFNDSVTVPLTAEKLRKQIELGRKTCADWTKLSNIKECWSLDGKR